MQDRTRASLRDRTVKDLVLRQSAMGDKENDSASTSSRNSKHSSSRSDMSSLIAQAKAKLEAAKARLRFTEMESDLKRKQAVLDQQMALDEAKVKREKAELSVNLELLAQQRETAALEAEANALDALDQESQLARSLLPDTEPADPFIRTKAYVEEDNCARMCSTNTPHIQDTYDSNVKSENDRYCVPPLAEPIRKLNPEASSFTPNNSVTGDFTRYLLKKDLLLSRLSAFDDRPESYMTWKVSFKTVMSEIDVSPIEELDFLLKWSGPESKRHVLSIKSANIADPLRGLQRAWERLEERFGCAEMIESSLKRRLETFPKLTAKDSKKLYELSDLVSEIESIKSDERMKSLLGHYDSSTGVNPIVNKLPHNLQEKWTSSAIRYMNEHHTAYPPFTHFAEFLREQSRIRNNPSFLYETTFIRKDTNVSNYVQKNSVVVKKTNTHHEVQSTASRTEDISVPGKCPIHNTDHPLNKCRAFRSKSIQERMKFLGEKRICFRCCASTNHIKKDCKEIVSCKECNSSSHPTALHIDTPSVLHTAALAHSGEAPIDITSKCTQICGRFPGKSCAKILLADVHLQDRPDNRVRAYIMLDDQSNRTLASSQLFDSLGIEGQDVEYILTSCA